MPARRSFADGVYIAVDKDGFVCNGANRSGPKLYVHESVARKKAGSEGKVFLVCFDGMKLV